MKEILKKNRQLFIFSCILLIFILYNFAKLKMANFDHLTFDNYNFIDGLKRTFDFSIRGQARPSFVAVLLTPIEYSIGTKNYYIWCILYVLISGIISGLIIKSITNNKYAFWGSLIIIISFYVITLEPASMPTAYALILGFGVISTLLAVYFTIQYNQSKKYVFKVFSIIFLLLAIFDYEVGILYLPVLIGINCIYEKSFNIKENLKKSWEFILVGIFYVIIYIAIKKIFVSEYDGNKLSEVFEPFKILYTWAFILFANIPGFFFFYNKSNAYVAPYELIHDFSKTNNSIEFILSNYITLFYVLQIILFIYVIYEIMKMNNGKNIFFDNEVYNKSEKNKIFNIILPIMLVIYCIIMPIFPSTLTLYTQEQVQNRWRLLLVANQYSYYFMMMVLCFFIFSILPRLKQRKVIGIILSAIMVIQFSLVAFTNEKNAAYVNFAGTRFEQFDEIIYEIASKVEDGAVIYSPTIISGSGIPSIPHFYFTARFQYLTGKNIRLIDKLERLTEPASSYYYLRYMYSDDKKDILFVLSTQNEQQIKEFENENININSNKRILLSDDVDVFCFSGRKIYNIIGYVDSESSVDINVKINNNPTGNIGTFDTFNQKIVQNEASYGKPIKVSFKAKKINVQSIGIYPQYETSLYKYEELNFNKTKIGNSLLTSKILNGYWKDGWTAKSAELQIQTGDIGKMNIDFYFPKQDIINDNSYIDIYIDGEKAGRVEKLKENNNFVLDTPKNKIIDIKFISNFEFDSNDGRTLSYIITNLNCE